jgi:electron-transferring-flavoprotein dehydrogenase
VVHDTDVCTTRFMQEYASSCIHFCPADFFEIADEETAGEGAPGKRLQDYAQIKDPCQIMFWTCPPGGVRPKSATNPALPAVP